MKEREGGKERGAGKKKTKDRRSQISVAIYSRNHPELQSLSEEGTMLIITGLNSHAPIH